jgi:putative restriction endonuclease
LVRQLSAVAAQEGTYGSVACRAPARSADSQHVDLLDAAHFVSDAQGGQPVVPNGLSLCKIHHAAYDRGILGVRRDYVVEVPADVLLEADGPMLKHGIQDVHGWTLEVPKRAADRPDQDLLELRWRSFSETP